MTELIFKEEVYAVIGAAIEVHRILGCGFLEGVYQEALEIEMQERGIPFEALRPLVIRYKNRQLKKLYVADFVTFGKIILELKALEHLSGQEQAQILNYLKATGFKLGLLINFGSSGKLEWERFIL